ncbi:hypothetical protein Zmor_020131 [Zophobas morio]|uniref:Flavin-containing monooxygenase n=1 Tax=Zophobas morio TaxID=2755281 RepID=A0AA38M974_9CUCU|nr:hypothetical protein Zmor_020131 [Zophobas morio]
MKIAIVGAGPAGLCAGRHCLKENFSVDIFEQTGLIGGTWNYVACTGYDEDGIPVHSSMYKDLKANLPKQLMSYEDLPYKVYQESYISQEQVLDYIKTYSKKFRLEDHVKFFKRVVNVEPQGNTWLIEFEDVRNNRREVQFYDAVMICNGHYKDAIIPEISGICSFQGDISHSCHYRTHEIYKGKRVLIIGAGTSGCDISGKISSVADKVYVSCKSKPFFPLPDSACEKPLVKEIDGNTAVFTDGTSAKIDAILYCTGYRYSFPFLSKKCGINVTDKNVHPLYKQIISIEHPTLAFIGVPLLTCYFPLFDIQARFFLSTLNGHYKLPSKEEILQRLNHPVASKPSRPLTKYHVLGEATADYFEKLATEANIKRIPPVISKLFIYVMMRRCVNERFRIIDDERWEKL